jgi:hypothetical protein
MLVELHLRTLLDSEVDALVANFLHARDTYEDGAPTMAEVYNALLIAMDDERRRRHTEHMELLEIMEHGDTPRQRPASGWRGDANDPRREDGAAE